jgi:hypothetical protein
MALQRLFGFGGFLGRFHEPPSLRDYPRRKKPKALVTKEHKENKVGSRRAVIWILPTER